jgi:hypothetical protein
VNFSTGAATARLTLCTAAGTPEDDELLEAVPVAVLEAVLVIVPRATAALLAVVVELELVELAAARVERLATTWARRSAAVLEPELELELELEPLTATARARLVVLVGVSLVSSRGAK